MLQAGFKTGDKFMRLMVILSRGSTMTLTWLSSWLKKW
jgi:hypothetical protein